MENPVPICARCKHFNRKRWDCAAFDLGIPEEILGGEDDHHEPLDDQENEIVFEEGEPKEKL